MNTLRNYKYLILSAFAFMIAAVFSFSPLLVQTPQQLTEKFREDFTEKQRELESLADYFSHQALTLSSDDLYKENRTFVERLYKDQGMSFFVFEDGEMVFWTDNIVPLLNYVAISELQDDILQIQNGWYRVVLRQEGNILTAGFMLIKKEYPHQNQYLENIFHSAFGLPEHTGITLDRLFSPNKIFDEDGNFLFGLIFSSQTYPSPLKAGIVLVFFLSGIILLIAFFEKAIPSCCFFIPVRFLCRQEMHTMRI